MVRWFHLTFRCNLSLCASQSMNWPLWPPAWDCYHCSSLQLVLRTLPQTHHGQEPWKNKWIKKNWKPEKKYCASSQRDIRTFLTFWRHVKLCCTSEVLYFDGELPSVRWVRQPSPQSSSWGCSPSWWWRSESCSVCTLDCADAPSLHAGRSSCGTTLNPKTRQTGLFYLNV